MYKRQALDFAAAPDPDGLDAPDMSEGINLFYHVQRAFAEAEVRAFARSLRGAAPAPGDIWYPSVGVLTCRRGPYALGAKAGGNDDSHLSLIHIFMGTSISRLMRLE